MPEWMRSWSPLALAVAFLLGAAVSLERDNIDSATALAAVGYLMIGIWVATTLYDKWSGRGD